MHQLQQIIEYQSSSTCSLSLGFPPLRPHMKSSEISGIFGPELSWSRNLTLETDGPAFAATGKSFNVVSGITECAKLASTRELRDDIQSRLDINPACKSHLLIHDSAFRIPAPFPQFFSKNVTAEGLISTTLQDGYVEKVPVVTRLNSGESINVLYEDAVKLLKASTKYGSTIPGFEREEINEITEYFDSKLEI